MNNANTVVYVRVKGNRPAGFADPPPFEWNVDKEKHLWAIVSKLDNYQDQIDWLLLSKTLEAPDYFLKKRSYKLFAMHLKLLEQQIERKMMTSDGESGSRQTSVQQFDPSNGAHTLTESGLESQGATRNEMSNSADETTLKTLQQLHTSKILNRARTRGGDDKDGRKNGSNSGSEASSSLSVSTSALEEALMDRLQL